jgi:hypothetical protein
MWNKFGMIEHMISTVIASVLKRWIQIFNDDISTAMSAAKSGPFDWSCDILLKKTTK